MGGEFWNWDIFQGTMILDHKLWVKTLPIVVHLREDKGQNCSMQPSLHLITGITVIAKQAQIDREL